jgi:hypothetical protein
MTLNPLETKPKGYGTQAFPAQEGCSTRLVVPPRSMTSGSSMFRPCE